MPRRPEMGASMHERSPRDRDPGSFAIPGATVRELAAILAAVEPGLDPSDGTRKVLVSLLKALAGALGRAEAAAPTTAALPVDPAEGFTWDEVARELDELFAATTAERASS